MLLFLKSRKLEGFRRALGKTDFGSFVIQSILCQILPAYRKRKFNKAYFGSKNYRNRNYDCRKRDTVYLKPLLRVILAHLF